MIARDRFSRRLHQFGATALLCLLGFAGAVQAEIYASAPSRTIGPHASGQGGTWTAADDRTVGAALVGQNGWTSGGSCASAQIDQEVTHAAAHSGDQSLRISNWFTSPCVDSIVSPAFAPVGESTATVIGSGGVLAASNTVTYDFWFRSASTEPDPGMGYVFNLSALSSYRLTFLKFEDSTNPDTCPTTACLHLKSIGIETDGDAATGSAKFVAHYSPELVRGDWYHVIVAATFNDGPLNDVINTQVFDSTGAQVWDDASNSWEFGYYSGLFNGHTSSPRPVQGPFAAEHVTFDISGSSGPGTAGEYASSSAAGTQGIYFDDLNVVPGSGAGYSTNFNSDLWVDANTGSDTTDCSDQASPCLTIAHALSVAAAGNTIHVASGTYADESLTIAKDDLRLIGEGATKPIITRQSGGTNQPLLVINGARNVRVENFDFDMDQSYVAEGVLAGGFVDGLAIVNNHFGDRRSNAAVDSTYGLRNAISINHSPNSQGLPVVGGSTVTVTGNSIDGVSDVANGVFLRAGVQLDSGNGTISGNTVTAGVQDIVVRFATATGASSGDSVAITGNHLFGRGLEFASPNASTSAVTISGNDIHAAAGIDDVTPYAADWSLVRLVHNPAGVDTSISGNQFLGHAGAYRGVLIENYPGIELDDNEFTPASGAANFFSLVVSNKELTSDNPAELPLEMSLAAKGNSFNGSGVAGAGTAVEFLNDNDAGGTAAFGSLLFGGAGSEANQFDGDLRWYFHLDDYNCDTAGSSNCGFLDYPGVGTIPDTEVRPFAGNVSAADNLYDGGAPSSTNASAILGRTFDKAANGLLGLVDYNLAASASIVFVDDSFVGHGYGDALTFTSAADGCNSQTVYFGINAFATIAEGISHVDTDGAVCVAKGIYAAGVTVNKSLKLVGDGNTVSDTVIGAGVTIAASGTDASNRLLLQNLRVSNPTGHGVSVASHSHLSFDAVAFASNGQSGLNFGGIADDIVISDSLFDGNAGSGIRTSTTARVSHVDIAGSTFSNNAVGILLFGASGSGDGQITNWSIDDSHFLSNDNADASNFGGGIWLKTGGAGSLIDHFSVTNSEFADNGSGNPNTYNQVGITVRARANTTMSNVNICNNTFTENSATPGTQLTGINVVDDTGNNGYQPIVVCASNTFTGLAHAISGLENRTIHAGAQPVVNITGGSIANTEYINQPVRRVRDSALFATINGALSDTGTQDGDEFHAPAGLYQENVVISRPGITLLGEGTALPLPAPSASAAAGPATAPVAVIDGTGLSGFGVEVKGGADSVTVAGFEVRNYADTCIRVQGGSDGATIQNNLVHHCGDSGHDGGIYVNVGGTVDGANINYNEVHDIYDRGIVVWNGKKLDVTIGNNAFTGPIGSTAIGIEDGTAAGLQIVNNNIDHSLGGDAGITMIQPTSGSPTSRPNLVANNTINDPGRFGISVMIPNGTGADSGDGAIVVEDNTVTGGTNTGAFSDDDRAGIQVIRRYYSSNPSQGQTDATRGVVVRKNTVTGFMHPAASQAPGIEDYGIVVEGVGSSVSGNTLSGNDVGLQVQQGNQPSSLPGSADSTIHTDFFDRGNTALSCVDIGTNAISSNGIDTRSMPAGVNLATGVTNTSTGKSYCSIQAAIDDAATQDGDTITVAASTYAENVVINKSLTLQGPFAGTPGHDASRDGTGEAVISPATGRAVLVHADNVVFDGFTIQNVNDTAIGSGDNYGGGSDTVQILDNRVLDVHSGSGLYTNGAPDTVKNWTVSGNLFRNIESSTGSGINLWKVSGGTITGNHVEDSAFGGIQINTAGNVEISGNVISNTAHNGINVGAASSVQVFGNTITDANTSGTVGEAGLTLYGGSSGVDMFCNSVTGSGSNGFSTSTGIPDPYSNIRVFDNAMTVANSVSHNLSASLVIGSNWYGGGSATVGGSNAPGVQVADPLSATPIGTSVCLTPDPATANAPTRIVAYAGTPQATPINTAFGQPLVARVEDALGGAVMGQGVDFATPAGGASAVLGTTSGTTDFNGTVSTTATANGTAGSYDVTASSGTLTTPATFALTNDRLVGTVTWDDLTFVYDGTAKTPTAHITEEPASTCTISPATVGPAASSYPVTATCTGTNYAASGAATATITPAPVTITLGNLTQTYDGTAKQVSVTTDPSGVDVDVTYDGSSTAPSAVGDYAVSVVLHDSGNYTGSAAGVLHIVAAEAADLSVSIDDGREYAQYGKLLTYTISVNNVGNTDISGASVNDVLPATLLQAEPSWTCVPVGTATCTANGTGDLSDTVSIPVNGGVVYLLNAWVNDDQSLGTDEIVNQVTVSAAGDTNNSNDSATDTTQAVIFRDGFEEGGDGAQTTNALGGQAALGQIDANSVQLIDLAGAWASDGRLVEVAGLASGVDSLQVQAIRIGGTLLVRLVGDADGKPYLGTWSAVAAGSTQLAASIAETDDGNVLLMIGAGLDVEVVLSSTSTTLSVDGVPPSDS